MIKLKTLLEASDNLEYILEKFREQTNWTDWYISGGCYSFADALYNFIGKNVKIWSVGDNDYPNMHVGIIYNRKYCDYNGCYFNKTNILDYVSIYGKPVWKFIKQSDLQREHNYDKSEVNKIIKKLNGIKND